MHPTELRAALGFLAAMALLAAAAARPQSSRANEVGGESLENELRSHVVCDANFAVQAQAICGALDNWSPAPSTAALAKRLSAGCCGKATPCSRRELERLCVSDPTTSSSSSSSSPSSSSSTLCKPLGPGRLTSVRHPERIETLCGKYLADELQAICATRGFNTVGSGYGPSAPSSEGVATKCCRRGCSRRYLESYCAPCNGVEPELELPPTEASASVENELRKPESRTEPPAPAPSVTVARSTKPTRRGIQVGTIPSPNPVTAAYPHDHSGNWARSRSHAHH